LTDCFFTAKHRVAPRHNLIRPCTELFVILERHAEQFGDDNDWQRAGVIGDEIRLAACVDAFEGIL
jgi:hypothetical protein